MNYKNSIPIVAILILSLLSGFASAQVVDERFTKALTAYNDGQYQLAIENFESLKEDGLSSSLLYNLANSYAQNGNTGMAVLNYEQAVRLAPGDSDIQGNLELLRKEKTLFQEEQNVIQRCIQLFGLDSWTILLMVGFILFAACLLLPVTPKLKTKTRRFVAVLSLLLTMTSVFGITGQYLNYHDAVVVVGDARLRISPFESAASSGSIQEGRLLTPVKKHNNFTLVNDETGRSGWLSNDEFVFIVP